MARWDFLLEISSSNSYHLDLNQHYFLQAFMLGSVLSLRQFGKMNWGIDSSFPVSTPNTIVWSGCLVCINIKLPNINLQVDIETFWDDPIGVSSVNVTKYSMPFPNGPMVLLSWQTEINEVFLLHSRQNMKQTKCNDKSILAQSAGFLHHKERPSRLDFCTTKKGPVGWIFAPQRKAQSTGFLHHKERPSQLELLNTLIVSLQKGNTPLMNVQDMTLNKIVVRQ